MRASVMAQALLVGVCAATLGCGNSGSTGPSAGTLKATLATPNGDDGAVLFAIRGPGIDSIVVSGTYNGYSRISANRDTAVVIVAGHVAAGVVVQLMVPDPTKFASYSASVSQVAQRSTFTQRTLGGYSVTIGQ